MPEHADRADAALLTWRQRALFVAAAVAVNGAIYLSINLHPMRTPALLPRTAVDAALGWHAWTIWPYWLLLMLAPAFALAIRERRLFIATLRAYAVAIGLNALTWLAFPTYLPRRAVPEGEGLLTDAAWRVLYALDANTNCFPSGHITLPLVIGAGFCMQYPRLAPWAAALVVALSPTIVTTGQHYAVDALGGAATAVLGLLLTRHPLASRVLGLPGRR